MPAPTSYRDLGGGWLASDRALSGAACIAGMPHKEISSVCKARNAVQAVQPLPGRQTGRDQACNAHNIHQRGDRFAACHNTSSTPWRRPMIRAATNSRSDNRFT